MGIPVALSWTAVTDAISELLSNGLVVAGVSTALALKFAPRIIGALRRSVSSR